MNNQTVTLREESYRIDGHGPIIPVVRIINYDEFKRLLTMAGHDYKVYADLKRIVCELEIQNSAGQRSPLPRVFLGEYDNVKL